MKNYGFEYILDGIEFIEKSQGEAMKGSGL